MKALEKLAEDSRARAKQLVADYSANGPGMLAKLSGAEVRILLSAKERHLAQVEQRCEQDQCLEVNVPLWLILTRHVKEIRGSLKEQERRMDMER